ncbi:MAG: divalent cation tolerance protein CutA [Candidatus Latescibacteria bacterium]|nr:divalent cation tolerance protein CutA [Candidatus Latescibacterota bacterium]
MKILIYILLVFLNTQPAQAQEPPPNEDHVASITRIVRHVTKGIVAPNQETLTPDQKTLITQISQQLIQDANIYQAEKDQIKSKHDEQNELITTIVINVGKVIAIIIALLILRWIIRAMGRGAAVEGSDTPLGVIITTRTVEEAHTLGKQMIDQALATGGSITPTTQSLYRKDDKAYAAPEAMLMLKTTNEHLKEIVAQTETSSTSAPEIIALSRSLIPS